MTTSVEQPKETVGLATPSLLSTEAASSMCYETDRLRDVALRLLLQHSTPPQEKALKYHKGKPHDLRIFDPEIPYADSLDMPLSPKEAERLPPKTEQLIHHWHKACMSILEARVVDQPTAQWRAEAVFRKLSKEIELRQFGKEISPSIAFVLRGMERYVRRDQAIDWRTALREEKQNRPSQQPPPRGA